ncbi:MAG TPA: universal stress protein [Longimicrobiales bacterium]
MYRTILLPLDGSLFSEHALPLALETARRANAALHVVHVYEADEVWRGYEEYTPFRFEGEPEYDEVYESEERGLVRRYLAWVARLAADRGVQVETALLDQDGGVTGAIERYAAQARADLVAMATHGRGGLSRAWLGSVADAVVRESGLPVLLVRPPGETRPDPYAAPTFAHVLVPLDESAEAEEVLGPATALGKLWDARYTLLTVVPLPLAMGTVSPAPVLDERGEAARVGGAAQVYLERVADRLRGDGLAVDTRLALDASAADAIMFEAGQLEADLIALATHGRSGLTRLVMGSVAAEVVRTAKTPVLVYRPRGGGAA